MSESKHVTAERQAYSEAQFQLAPPLLFKEQIEKQISRCLLAVDDRYKDVSKATVLVSV